MLFWFAATSIAIVWVIFRSPAVDYRLVAVGSLLPLLELPFGMGVLHTLLGAVVALCIVMGATVGRRLVRRQWLGIPIGLFLALVLGGVWSDAEVFWWPLGGGALWRDRTPVLELGLWTVLFELAGIMVALWLWSEFGLDDADRRRRFFRTGQLDRTYMRAKGKQLDD